MTDFGFTVTGDRRVALKFDEFPKALHDRILARIASLTSRLEARVRSAAPTATGKLQSLIVSKVYDNAQDRIRGRVTVSGDFGKAAALEYGARKTAKVKAHEMRLDHVFANRLAAPLTVMVAAHSRQPNIAERKFLRGPIAAMRPEIVQELRQAVADAASETV